MDNILSFLKHWWIYITGLASLLSLIIYPEEGIAISKGWFYLFTLFVASILIGLGFTSKKQSKIVNKRKACVITFQKNDNYGDDFLCVFECLDYEPEVGTLLELKRQHKGADVTFALMEYVEKNTRGHFQARVLWVAPAQLLELHNGSLVLEDLFPEFYIKSRTLYKLKDKIFSGANI